MHPNFVVLTDWVINCGQIEWYEEYKSFINEDSINEVEIKKSN